MQQQLDRMPCCFAASDHDSSRVKELVHSATSHKQLVYAFLDASATAAMATDQIISGQILRHCAALQQQPVYALLVL